MINQRPLQPVAVHLVSLEYIDTDVLKLNALTVLNISMAAWSLRDMIFQVSILDAIREPRVGTAAMRVRKGVWTVVKVAAPSAGAITSNCCSTDVCRIPGKA